MRPSKLIVLGALISSYGGTAAWPAQIGQSHFYGWDISAYTNDSNGFFSHCTASVGYHSGISLVFAIGRDYSWSMGLMNPAWQFSLGDKYPVQYQVDNTPIMSATADVLGSNLVGIPLVDSGEFFTLFKLGRILKIKTGDQIFRFDLTNSSKALNAASMCTTAKLAAENGGGSNPFVRNQPTPQDSPPNDAVKAEAAAVTANLLSAAKIDSFQVADTIPPGLEMFHSVWSAPGILGGLTIGLNQTVEQASATLVGMGASSCKGHFASAKLPSAPDGTASVKTACDNDVVTYVLIPRPKGGVYVMLLMKAPTPSGQQPRSTLAAPDTDRPDVVTGQLISASYAITGKAR